MEDLLSSLNTKEGWEGILFVDVEDASLADDFTFEIAMRYLSLGEQIKVRRKKTVRAQKITLCNKLLQLFGCSIIGGVPFQEVRFEYGDFGKPYMNNSKGISFSMSNGDQHVVQYIFRGNSDRVVDIGVDVAAKNDYAGDSDLELFRDVFSEGEYANLKKCDTKLRPKMFAYYWSLKECYTKFTGLGLNCNLPSINFDQPQIPLKSSGIQRNLDGHSMLFHSTWIQQSSEEIVTVCREDGYDIRDRARWLLEGPTLFKIDLRTMLQWFERPHQY